MNLHPQTQIGTPSTHYEIGIGEGDCRRGYIEGGCVYTDLAADGSPAQDGTEKINVDEVVQLYGHHIVPLNEEVGAHVVF